MAFYWFLNQATGDMSTAIPCDQQQRELTEGESESQGDEPSPLHGDEGRTYSTKIAPVGHC